MSDYTHEKSPAFVAVLDAIAQFRAELYAFGPCYLGKLSDDKKIAQKESAKKELVFDTLKAKF